MDSNERKLLVETWIKSNQKAYVNEKASKESLRASMVIYDVVHEDPELAWELILQILTTNQSDETYASLAAGPMEDLLIYHGEEFIERVEELAKSDDSFNKLLGGVWKNAINIDIWHRVEKVRKSIW